MLQLHGYHLRQWYKPDWKPSWLKTRRPPALHNDFKPNWSNITIDAVQIADGRRVFLKRILASCLELKIHCLLSDEERLKDSRNHTVPLLDVFLDDSDPSFVYMVMPLLHRYYLPEFFSINEVVNFMKQLLEGLVYMHERNITHRDCSELNIMMDAEPIFPRGSHPLNLLTDAGGYKKAHTRHRRDVPSVRYYYIDFGISAMLGPDEENRKVLGLEGQDKSVPELSDTKPYDLFAVDVQYLFWETCSRNLSMMQEYENLIFFDPLIDDMTLRNPRYCASAAEALEMFNAIISRQTQRSLIWRLKSKASGKVMRFLQDVDSISWFSQRTPYKEPPEES